MNLTGGNSMKKQKPFQIPKAILSMLEECTTGFYLVSINENGEFDTHVYYPTPSAELSLINFVDIQSTAAQEILRHNVIEDNLDQDDED